jgi:hypothetical protein
LLFQAKKFKEYAACLASEASVLLNIALISLFPLNSLSNTLSMLLNLIINLIFFGIVLFKKTQQKGTMPFLLLYLYYNNVNPYPA